MNTSPTTAESSPPPRLVVEYAGFWRRMASLLYETLLGMGILALGFLVPYLLLGLAIEWAPPGWFLWLHVFFVLGAYFVWYWKRNGQTLAMQTWRLKIVNAEDGKVPSPKRAMLRYAIAWPSVLLCGIGLWWVLLDRDRQFLHDRLAHTVIVLMPPEPKI